MPCDEANGLLYDRDVALLFEFLCFTINDYNFNLVSVFPDILNETVCNRVQIPISASK